MIALNKFAIASFFCLAAATAKDATTAKGLIFLPGDSEAHELTLTKTGDSFKLDADPSDGKISWKISITETH